MGRKSRFLKQSSMPPSSENRLSYRLNPERGCSLAPSRSNRAASTAPMMRASSQAPARYRSTSMAPGRASSVVSYRARSVAPFRASSVTPYRASSVTPYRASSVTPYRASSVVPQRISSYTLSTAPYEAACSSAARSYRSSSLPPTTSVSFRSTPLVTSNKTFPRIDTSIPTRQFGTRLGIQKMETTVKPAIYDEYYGTTYVPSSGRDSWSAYRISDETLDDNDDLVYASAKKDHEVMKRVNKQIQQVNMSNATAYRRAPVRQTEVYRAPAAPAAKVTYSTVYDSDSYLRPKNKSITNETIELARPAAFNVLKERLRNAQDNMDRSRTASAKYTRDPELTAISSEVSAIRNARALREQSLVPTYSQIIEDKKTTSDLRKRIRSTLRKSKRTDD